MSTIAHKNNLNAMDPELPFLASKAAIELDNILLGKTVELQSVKELAERLEHSTEKYGASERSLLMNPSTVSVLSNALSGITTHQINTLGELAEEAWQIASALNNPPPKDKDESRLKELRDFCVCLAQNAVAYERSHYDVHPVDRSWS